jgi:RNA polymerase sigma factor for flagellar operon FliA
VDEVERARLRLVERHLDLARRAAVAMHKRVRSHLELEDVIGLANEGLAQAAATYDETKGTAFTSWAWYRINGAMLDGIRRSSNLPRRVWRQLVALRAAGEYLENLGEREAGAAQRGVRPKQGKDALAAIKDALSGIRTMYVTSLDAMQEHGFDKDDGDAPLGDQLDSSRLARKLRAALDALPEKERALVTKHYYEGKNLLEAGAELGISKSWASRLHAQAVEKLRAIVDAEASSPANV